MNQLKVVSLNGQLVTDSRDVAKMTNKEHKELLRSIRQYISVLTSANLRPSEFFIPHYYADAKKEQRPCFLLTKKGCDMVANKMTGEKGVLFTAAYVSKFEEMEQQLAKPNNTKLLLQTALEHEEKIEIHDKRISLLEESMRIDGIQERKIQNKGNQVVIEFLGGKNSPAYKKISRKAFSELWRDFKNHFMIPRFSELPKKQFEEGLRFIGMWQPSTSLRIDIENTNQQQTMKGVI